MSRDPSNYEVYFHVGLGRAASTYVQNRIFPQLNGIRYIPRDRYRNFPEVIERTQDTKYLVSREAALRLEARLQEFSSYRRDAKVILVLRRHDHWIASHYRRYVKNGGSYPFDRFLDLDNRNTGLWSRTNLEFMSMIRMIERYFASQPLVLFQEDLATDRDRFLSRLMAFTGTTCLTSRINPEPVHRSYSDKQLRVSRRIGSLLFPPIPAVHPNPTLHRIYRRRNLVLCHLILGVTRLVPGSMIEDKPLIPPDQLTRVRNEYAKDWESCLEFAKAQNPFA